MKVDLDRCVLVSPPRAERREAFEAVRETVAHVGPRPHHGHEALRHADVECHPGELVPGAICARCGHLLSAIPAADGRSVRVRCVFFESDPVTTVMTRALDVVSAEAREPLAVAAARMLDRHVEQLVVTQDGAAVGLITAGAAEGPTGDDDDRVLDRMAPLPVVPRSMTLAAVSRGLGTGDVGCAVVVDGDELVGIVTRGDLRRSGVPEL